MSKHSVQSSNNGVTVRVGSGKSIKHGCNTTDAIVTYSGDTKTHDHVVISDTGNVLFKETIDPTKVRNHKNQNQKRAASLLFSIKGE